MSATGRAWVIISTGSNQEWIFRTNRQRYAVGASALLKSLTEWVAAAVTTQTGTAVVDVIVATSGTTLLLVDDPDVGRRIVSSVTRTALAEAPGLDIWGYVEDQLSSTSNHVERLGEVYSAHARARWMRPSPLVRAPLAPFMEVCTTTGLPADVLAKPPGAPTGAPTVPMSRMAVTVLSNAGKAYLELGEAVRDAVGRGQKDEVSNAGWLAVIHADGNGVGALVSGLDSAGALRRFSAALEEATAAAFTSAVVAVAAEHPNQGWLRPLVVGGDDVTMICDARVAVDLTSSFLTAFEREAAARPDISGPAKDLLGRPYLTASAGIACIKPKYPFHAAYRLAEELATSAKQVKRPGRAPHRSSYDLHVLHDSVSRPLADLRHTTETQVSTVGLVPVSLWAGPLLAPAAAAPSAGGTWETSHEGALLLEWRDQFTGPREDRPLSSSALHRLRTAVLAGGHDPLRASTQIIANAPHPAPAQAFVEATLSVWDGYDRRCSLLTLLDLVDIKQDGS